MQIFGLRVEVESAEITKFFGKYGIIESLSKPNTKFEIDADLYHVNILYQTKDEAEKALKQGAEDEKKCMPRLTTSELRI